MAADSSKTIAAMSVGEGWARLRSLGVDDMTAARLQLLPPTDPNRVWLQSITAQALSRLQAMPCPTEMIQ